MYLPKHWILNNTEAETAIQAVSAHFAISYPIATLLCNRVKTIDPGQRYQSYEAFLSKDPSLLTPSEDFPGVKLAAQRLFSAIVDGTPITVFGDYDTDGITATALLWITLRKLGAQVKPFIPDREREGYGLSDTALVRCIENTQPKLLITVDCGITAISQCKALQEQGVDVIITDHHTPGTTLPPALVIVNPHVETICPESAFCGCAIAYKVADCLIKIARKAHLHTAETLDITHQLDLVALATIADVINLTGESRILVAEGIKAINKSTRIGLRELLQKQGLAHKTITSETLAFSIIPYLNAAGRMNSPKDTFKLLLSTDPESIVSTLQKHNTDRKQIETDALKHIMANHTFAPQDAAYVVSGDYHPGVIGLIASRLSESVAKPVAVATILPNGTTRGSMRAGNKDVSAIGVLTTCQEHLDAFGGHAAAAGFTIRAGAYDAFCTAFKQACSEQTSISPCHGGSTILHIDVCLTPEEISLELLNELMRLEPFGEGNPKPVFALCHQGLKLCSPKACGKEQNHLQAFLQLPNGDKIKSIWFDGVNKHSKLDPNADYVVAFHLNEDTYRERQPSLQIIALEERPTQC